MLCTTKTATPDFSRKLTGHHLYAARDPVFNVDTTAKRFLDLSDQIDLWFKEQT